MTRVKNANGTSRFSSPNGYGSWLEYWETQTGDKKTICGASGCNNDDLVGAHVVKANGTDKSYYITPLCRSCNQSTDEFDVFWKLVPVPSNL